MMEGCSVLRFQTDFCFSANASQHLSPNNLSTRFKTPDKAEMAAVHFPLFLVNARWCGKRVKRIIFLTTPVILFCRYKDSAKVRCIKEVVDRSYKS